MLIKIGFLFVLFCLSQASISDASFLPTAVNGNIGIGTTVPSEKMEVVGTVKATDFTGDGSGLTNVQGTVSGLSTAVVPVASSGTVLVDSGIYVTGGNVGIGSATPGAKLNVKGDINLNNNIIVSDSSNQVVIDLAN